MTRIDEIKAQLAVLRNQLREIAIEEKLPIDQKTNKAIKISRDIRKQYALNQKETERRIWESRENKPQIPISHNEALIDPLDNQNPLKTQLSILRGLTASKNAKDDYQLLGSQVSAILESNSCLDEAKRIIKLFGEINCICNLNFRETDKRLAVSKANVRLGFDFTPVFLEDFDEEPFE